MRLFNKIIIFSLVFILISCSKEKKIININTEFEINLKDLALEDYSKNALKILEQHKEHKLQVALPNIILEEVNQFDQLLIEYEKKQTYATSDMEFLRYKQEIDHKLLDSLILKDIQMNLIYNDMLSQLEDLNKEYSNKYNIDIDGLDSFFDVDNILLSDEVLIKIKELSVDEKTRKKIEANQNNESIVVDGVSVIASAIPFGSAISKTALRGISTGIKLAKRGKDLPKQATTITSVTYDLMKNSNGITYKTGNFISKKLSNDIKRQVLAERQLISIKRGITKTSLNKANSLRLVAPMKLQRSREYFKKIENKLEGRIGDFSDGILAVHLQNVRELIKKNQSKLIQDSNTKLLK